MAAEPTTAHQLSYGTQPPSFRRWLRLFYLSGVLIAIVAGGWVAKDAIAHRFAKYQYGRQADRWYPRVVSRMEAPAVLKYTENPSDAPYGFTSSVGGVGFEIRGQDPAIDRLPMFNGRGDPILSNDWCIVFAHERTNSTGLTRLLMVSMNPWQGGKIWLSTYQIVRHTGGTLQGMIGMLKSTGNWFDMSGFATPGSLRVFSGQPDPKDASRFYIPFESNGRHGRICGVFVAGDVFSKDPHDAAVETEMNSDVHWTVTLDAPATTRNSN